MPPAIYKSKLFASNSPSGRPYLRMPDLWFALEFDTFTVSIVAGQSLFSS